MPAEAIKALEFVLGAVVQCEQKAEYVRDIMLMDDAVQVDIMAVIERIMTTTAALAQTASAREDDAADSASRQSTHDDSYHTTHNRSMSESPSRVASGADVDRLTRANSILREENAHLSIELQEVQSKCDRMREEHDQMVKSIQDLKVQAEMDLLKKERSMRNMFDDRVHQLQQELNAALAELEEQRPVVKAVNELRDEIDLLRPAAERLTKAETTISKYKVKIEELTSAKEKLRVRATNIPVIYVCR
ncbi:hypothetical protein PINS_up000759 [Pythium insidiosum]|nr:hypothetical protein PINS_up000759 [Pythium insidiosum]